MLPGRREVGLQTILTTVPVLVVLPMALFCAVLLYTLHARNEHDVQRDLAQAESRRWQLKAQVSGDEGVIPGRRWLRPAPFSIDR